MRWAGWSAQYDSWEPAKHIDQRLVDEFERREAEAAVTTVSEAVTTVSEAVHVTAANETVIATVTAMETEPRLVSAELLSDQREGEAARAEAAQASSVAITAGDEVMMGPLPGGG